jgi:hypothetical protein
LLRRVERLMKREHMTIRARRSEPFVKKARSLYSQFQRHEAAIEYRKLVLEMVNDAEIDVIADPSSRGLLLSVKHVHEKDHGKGHAEIFKGVVYP